MCAKYFDSLFVFSYARFLESFGVVTFIEWLNISANIFEGFRYPVIYFITAVLGYLYL